MAGNVKGWIFLGSLLLFTILLSQLRTLIG